LNPRQQVGAVTASDAKELHMKGSLRVAHIIARHMPFLVDF
jgi:hypothetical protein